MARVTIPERQPVGDAFTGIVVQSGARQALAFALGGADVLHEAPAIVRYGVRFLGKPHLSIVPGLIVVDYGQMLTGEPAWDFLINHSNRYPRAEVFGYRNDGRDDMMLVRALDLAMPPEVLVYSDASATAPLARPTALIAAADAPALPARLLAALSRFETMEDWLGQTG